MPASWLDGCCAGYWQIPRPPLRQQQEHILLAQPARPSLLKNFLCPNTGSEFLCEGYWSRVWKPAPPVRA